MAATTSERARCLYCPLALPHCRTAAVPRCHALSSGREEGGVTRSLPRSEPQLSLNVERCAVRGGERRVTARGRERVLHFKLLKYTSQSVGEWQCGAVTFGELESGPGRGLYQLRPPLCSAWNVEPGTRGELLRSRSPACAVARVSRVRASRLAMVWWREKSVRLREKNAHADRRSQRTTRAAARDREAARARDYFTVFERRICTMSISSTLQNTLQTRQLTYT